MAVIFWLSSLTGSSVPSRFSSLGHFTVYAVLGAAYLVAMPSAWPMGRRLLVAVVLASLYGVTDEYHQSFVPGRMPDPVDWIVDTIGALAGSGVVAAALHRTAARPSSEPEGPELRA